MEASLPGLLRFILILIIIYYAFKLIVRYVLPWLAKRGIKNFQKRFYEQNPHLDPDPKKEKEGEIKVKRNGNSGETHQKHKDNDFGEYIDYEEIKD